MRVIPPVQVAAFARAKYRVDKRSAPANDQSDVLGMTPAPDRFTSCMYRHGWVVYNRVHATAMTAYGSYFMPVDLLDRLQEDNLHGLEQLIQSYEAAAATCDHDDEAAAIADFFV